MVALAIAGCGSARSAGHPLTTTSVVGHTQQIFDIPSDAMAPTLVVGDKVSVVASSALARGDIVVFKAPAELGPGVGDIIKRIVGLPGETISSGPGGGILIDGKPINETWLPASAKADLGQPIPKMAIPTGEYYVLGDNRANSLDSRQFGPIPSNLVIGVAKELVYPAGRARRLTP